MLSRGLAPLRDTRLEDVLDEAPQSQTDEFADDPALQLREDLAELLAALSSEADSPTDFDQLGVPFTRDDVDYDSDSWMAAVAAVQGWFRFGTPLSTGDPAAFAHSLASALDFDSVDQAVDLNGPVPQLTPVALDRLRTRAEHALQLQRLFAEEFLSEDGTRETATRAWKRGWESDEETDEPATAEPVSAKADTWKISEFVSAAQSNKLNLTPSYQRGDVWPTSSRQILIESILRGIPLPSVILLKPSTGDARPFEVVDGKQRLTSILRFLGKHPLAVAKVRQADEDKPGHDLMGLFESDYPKFKRAWKTLFNEPITASVEERYYFPFKLRTDDRGLAGDDLAPLRGKYYTQIKDRSIQIADGRATLTEVFETHSDYKIPIIIYSRATQRQIHEVFNLYNKQGTHLNAEEIRNAIFHELELTRAMLVAAGDADERTPPGDIAPCLSESGPTIQLLKDALVSYGFGSSRYRRTKVLSWIIATLLTDTGGANLPSTARHIDSLLQRVQSDPGDPLRDSDTVRRLIEWVASAADIHSGVSEVWATSFRGEDGGRWQELQLVGSVVGVALASAVLGKGLEAKMIDTSERLYRATTTWKRPDKTQTREQWRFISKIALGVLEQLEVDPVTASALIRSDFGSSGVEGLLSAINYDRAR